MTQQTSRQRSDDGFAAVQTVIMIPVIALLVFGTFGFVLYYHAAQIARLAASQGMETARVQGGTQTSGKAAADRYLTELGRSTLRDGHVVVQRGVRETRVEVHGYAEQIVPFLHLPVHATVTAPTETIGSGP